MVPSDSKNAQRFNISLPVHLTKAGARCVSQILTTRNVSTSRILMNCPSCPVEVGQEVEYFVTLPTHASETPVRVRCLGHVIGSDPLDDVFTVSIERHEFVSDQPALRLAS